ncbi:AAA family ATPase [Dictyobacter kobayashii]|uniref:Nuclease SbcCD subunit C n=1 Tax=Dictyobacter kobayashii TaxID=2014872 RepID=A0A402AJK0_9CHLR|nr:SMC family ATPase [Dictyobacter kobayashii]GCE19230.1 hypothetical protein KDK_30300 [Dictyobacter kobayashii]
MLITRIELENIKSYRQVSVDFRRGTTAISGSNGAGKTTLVEAIGFALFGYLPYNQEQFVREGEKGGKVVVHLIGSDDRPYTVERRCGTGARWLVYDEEADMRLEQRADVMDKLHELFGIDNERSLEALFRDALGVPQGTFTSIFLDTATKRKQTFDALLQIEDYQTAAKYLLGTQNYYKEQKQAQQVIIDRLQYETRELDDWRTLLHSQRLVEQANTEKNLQFSEQLSHYEKRRTILEQQAEQVRNLGTQYDQARSSYEFAHSRLQDRQQSFQTAREAQQIVLENQDAYQSHEQANATLRQLRRDATNRDALRQQQAQTQSLLIQVNERITHQKKYLQEVEHARRRIADLAPQVEQQVELERQRDEARQQRQRYNDVYTAGAQRKNQLSALRQEQEQSQRKIAAIEPLLPLAELLDVRTEAHTQLRLQANTRTEKQRQFKEKSVLLRERQAEREPLMELLRKAENNVKLIEEHRQEAEEMPQLEQELKTLDAQRIRLEGNIEGYARSKAESAGGQCPLLNESCLNIRQRGIVSLESYFENLLTEEQDKIETITIQQRTLTRRKNQIQRFADALLRFSEYVERRDERAANVQRLERDLVRLTEEFTVLKQDLLAIDQVEQQLKQAEIALRESKQADAQVRELDGLKRQSEQLQKQIEQVEAEIAELRQEANQLQGSAARLKQLEDELVALNDPRSESRAKQDILARESSYQQQLHEEQQRLQEIQQRLQKLDEELVSYAALDKDIAFHEALIQQSQAGYHRYLQYQNEASNLPEREQAYQQQQALTTEAEQHLQTIQRAFEEAQTAFQQQELQDLRTDIERIRSEQIQLVEQMKTLQAEITRLEQKIEQTEKLLVELESAQAEYQTLDDLHKMMGQFRDLIKDAAPHVLKAMLADISAEANRIFGEVMGDRRAQLAWRNDYEIILRQQGVDRSFAQLSGGEQMSAALAVRLALLKKLSTLNIAFFDEPTQNMDELRRMNLAEQIRRVRGFDQLIVISHDDTFEQGLDSLVRLNKVNGETRILDDDDGTLPQTDFGQAWPNADTGSSQLQPTN